MMSHRVLLAVGCVFTLAASAATPEPPPTEVFDLLPQWTLERGGDAPYALDPRWFDPGELIGATVGADGSVYLCDKITNQLIKLAPGGHEAFAVGSVGTGPEDHGAAGEPVPWYADTMARADFRLPPKILVYGRDGGFVRSLSVPVDAELARLFWTGSYGVAILVKTTIAPPAAADFSARMVLLDDHGLVLNEQTLRTWHLERGAELKDTDLWHVPRMAASNDGSIFVLRELTGTSIDCYDDNLQPVWTIDTGLKQSKRTEAELASVMASGISHMTPDPFNPPIRRLVARHDGVIWIQPWRPGEVDGTVEFEAFGRGGVPSGTVRVSGLPALAGEWIICGNKVLWMADDDLEPSNGTIPYITVFDLVRR